MVQLYALKRLCISMSLETVQKRQSWRWEVQLASLCDVQERITRSLDSYQEDRAWCFMGKA